VRGGSSPWCFGRLAVAQLRAGGGRWGPPVPTKDGPGPQVEVRAVGGDVIGEGAHDAGVGDVRVDDDDLLAQSGQNRRAGAAGAITLEAGPAATGTELWRPRPAGAARTATVEPGAGATHAGSAEIGWQIER